MSNLIKILERYLHIGVSALLHLAYSVPHFQCLVLVIGFILVLKTGLMHQFAKKRKSNYPRIQSNYHNRLRSQKKDDTAATTGYA